MGWVGLLASSRGLTKVTLPQESAEEALRLLGNTPHQATLSAEGLYDIASRLRAYFSGYRVSFPNEPDLSGLTPFQAEVCRATRLIPHGETRSYSWVAKQMDKPGAVRAVGQALARNPLPVVIPCHRVVRSDGRLGGFADGLEMKRRLLELEAAGTVSAGCISQARQRAWPGKASSWPQIPL